MSDPQIFPILSVIVLITVTAGYRCLIPRAQNDATASAPGVQEINVIVKGEYSPNLVVVQQRRRVRFKFARQESGMCPEQVLFPDFNKDVSLLEYEQAILGFPPHVTWRI